MPLTGWVLEGYLEGSPNMVVTPIPGFPFRVGRRTRSGLRLASSGVSSAHAELDHDGSTLWVRDLNSTNGTYVNRRRVRGKHPLQDGDIVHFATTEFVLRHVADDESDEQTVHRTIEDLPQRSGGREQIARMLAERSVVAHFQPIITLADRESVVAWEALGRGRMEGMPVAPALLLERADHFHLAPDLSQLFRERAAEDAHAFGESPTIFLNCHPAELHGGRLVGQLDALRQAYPQVSLVLEIHEKAVTDVARLRDLVRDLAELGIRTAYDDFGAGQARLLELVDATPAFVKFDKAWTRGVEVPGSKHTHMVRTLVGMVLDFGITPVCEGIENEGQAQACHDLGFVLGQGYLFGRPEPAPLLRRDDTVRVGSLGHTVE